MGRGSSPLPPSPSNPPPLPVAAPSLNPRRRSFDGEYHFALNGEQLPGPATDPAAARGRGGGEGGGVPAVRHPTLAQCLSARGLTPGRTRLARAPPPHPKSTHTLPRRTLPHPTMTLSSLHPPSSLTPPPFPPQVATGVAENRCVMKGAVHAVALGYRQVQPRHRS